MGEFFKYRGKCGIYKIENKINGNLYIGSSTDLRVRLWNHKSLLKNGRHENEHLQRAWDKYGAKSFKFEILLFCEKDNMLEREQELLDFWKDTKHLYNMNYEAKDPPHYLKPVVCWDLDLNFVKEFDSMKEAAGWSGASTGRLTDICKKNREKYTTKGYYWAYKGEEPFVNPRGRRRKSPRFVFCLNRNEKIKKYDSANEAAEDMNVKTHTIQHACSGNKKIKGFYWQYGELNRNYFLNHE